MLHSEKGKIGWINEVLLLIEAAALLPLEVNLWQAQNM